MIEYREIPDTNIIEVMFDGQLTAVDYHNLAERVLAFIEKHGKVRILKEIRAVTGVDMGVFKEKLIMTVLKHFFDFTGAAVVCDQAWIENLTLMLTPVYTYPVRCFKRAQIEEAREWLKSLPAVEPAKPIEAEKVGDSCGKK